MKNVHRLIALALIVAAFGLAAWFYPRLPDPVPVHWNASGEVDGTAAKPWGVLFLPLMMIAQWLIFEAIVRFSPRGFRLEAARDVVGILAVATIGLLLLVFAAQVLMASGRNVSLETFLGPGIGLLLIVLGNYLGKVPKNFFIGMRTPWTLASDEVWYRTHRFAAPLFVIAGLILVLAMPFGAPYWLLPATVLPAAIAPLIYSFVVYRRLEGFRADNGIE